MIGNFSLGVYKVVSPRRQGSRERWRNISKARRWEDGHVKEHAVGGKPLYQYGLINGEYRVLQ